MNGNIFEKINTQSEMIDAIAAAQVQQSELLQQILEQVQSHNEATGSESAPMNAQIQQKNQQLMFQRFMHTATKTYHYFGDADIYQKEKSKTLVFLVLTIIVGVVSNVLTSVAVGLFSTFSLIEDLWLFLVFRIICHVVHSKRFYDHIEYSAHSFETFSMCADGLYYPKKLKLSYKIIKVLALISAPCNIIFLCTRYQGAVTVFAIIFEVIVFAAVFFSLFVARGFFSMYTIIYYSGKNQSKTAVVTLVFDSTFQKLYLKEEYEKQFPMAK